jgi:hypothetical protein
MEINFFKGRDSFLTADVDKERDVVSEDDNLLRETEETKLYNYIRERSRPDIGENSGPELDSVCHHPRQEHCGCSPGSGKGGRCPWR